MSIKQYLMIKRAEPVYKSELILPVTGAGVGGGIGAYTGRGWKNKLLRGVVGAGIGGNVGLGLNWLLDKLNLSEAAKKRLGELIALKSENRSINSKYNDQKRLSDKYNNFLIRLGARLGLSPHYAKRKAPSDIMWDINNVVNSHSDNCKFNKLSKEDYVVVGKLLGERHLPILNKLMRNDSLSEYFDGRGAMPVLSESDTIKAYPELEELK